MDKMAAQESSTSSKLLTQVEILRENVGDLEQQLRVKDEVGDNVLGTNVLGSTALFKG